MHRRIIRAWAAGLLALPCLLVPSHALEPPASAAAALQAKHIELQPQLRDNIFGEPLHLSSREGQSRVEGDVYAEMAYPIDAVAATFKSAARLCELLFLHLNVRRCEPESAGNRETLVLSVGPKRARVSGQVYDITYALRIESAEASYFRATLSAAEGPLSTRDYRIVFEAMPISGSHTFIHLGYAYSYGTMAKLAMNLYLSTAGRAKIGFTVVGKQPDGKPLYVRGERGSLERNVMRYYLALLAYNSINAGSPQEKMAGRLRKWFALTERYPAQLHELDLNEYLEEKQADLARATTGHR
ncbi:hypothetical protein [Janthinobacterium sp. 17J80-10]|uniref:hypothetical protein n=1 Tax=Janthinobacterium sp. 17J80-10 TaxID=2497863 RepID=UPI00100592E9|nr:hypothetical protein [Janthinobacterium sp. 17J80-10]QAU34956.1 hypothetical protein EKL02_12615 [Janthinobacterium sp. 17J80-10]